LTAFACVVVGSQLFGIDCAVISSFSSIIAAANSNASVFFTLACFEELWMATKNTHFNDNMAQSFSGNTFKNSIKFQQRIL